jgi:HD-GYP domain-containing protein (c-di-GMP phosphodiesterase class II)
MHKKFFCLYVLLFFVSVPVISEVVFGLFSPQHQPFQTIEELYRTGFEMFFMVVVWGFLCFLNRQLDSTKAQQKELDKLIAEKIFEIELTQRTSIEALATVAEHSDSETGIHLRRIQEYVLTLTEELLSDSPYNDYIQSKATYIEELVVASVLHDIGKIVIPSRILLKPGRLTPEEFDEIKKHTVVAGEMLARANNIFLDHIGKDSYLALARDIAMYHHEKWDGSGYSRGLKGEDIPLSARIVALCDVYDAVTTDRVYKKAWTHDEAVKMILKNRGTHFDPVVTDAFIRLEKIFNRIRLNNSVGGNK